MVALEDLRICFGHDDNDISLKSRYSKSHLTSCYHWNMYGAVGREIRETHRMMTLPLVILYLGNLN